MLEDFPELAGFAKDHSSERALIGQVGTIIQVKPGIAAHGACMNGNSAIAMTIVGATVEAAKAMHVCRWMVPVINIPGIGVR
ncbi:hypothetical protein ACFL6E_03880 [Candidatus Neomarinimicrobiota bacterium]